MDNTKKYEIVSLGLNCMPRTILTRHGIKPSKAQGELSGPFDLVRHKLGSVICYLENDFKEYCDDLFFTQRKRCFLDFRGKGIWKKPDGTKFFHDKDCGANDREKLVERISRRINNFRCIVNNDKPILFVLNTIDTNTDSEIDLLYDTLKKIRGDKFFKLAVIDFSNMISQTSNRYVLSLVEPIEKYNKNWNRTSFVKSKLGKYTEDCICSFIKHILEKDFEK